MKQIQILKLQDYFTKRTGVEFSIKHKQGIYKYKFNKKTKIIREIDLGPARVVDFIKIVIKNNPELFL